MKVQRASLVIISLIISTLLLAPASHAAFAIRLEKDIRWSDIPPGFTTLSFNIYDSETAPAPIASEDIVEWTAEWDSNGDWITYSPTASPPANVELLRFKGNFTNIVSLTIGMDLWFDILLNGIEIGPREPIKKEAWALFSVESLNAFDITCANCVELGTETSGNFDSTPDTIADDGVITLGVETTGSYDPTPDTIADDGVITLGIETTGSYDPTPDTIADDNVISSSEVNFNYAGSSSKGGAALNVPWTGITGMPGGFADGVDDVGGITSESDPQVGSNTTNYVPKWNGSALVTGTIYDNGKVGIGTTNPVDELHVKDNDWAYVMTETTGDYDAGIKFKATSVATEPGGINQYAMFIYGGNNSGDLVINEDYINGQWQPTGRFFIQNDTGNIGIGVPNPAYRLELPNIGNTSGRGRANAWYTYSSRRWKENITPVENALDKVNQLQGVSFNWKEELGGDVDIGFIAEDVGQVLPEIVDFEENGIDAKALAYDRITAVLVEAVKELKAENDNLRERLNSLEKIVGSD